MNTLVSWGCHNYNKLGGLNDRNVLSHSSEGLRSRQRQGMWMAIFSPYPHIVFRLYVGSILISPSHNNTSFNYFLKYPISKYSYNLRYWGFGLQHRNILREEHTIWSITADILESLPLESFH